MPRHVLLSSSLALASIVTTMLAACASSDPEVAKTAADATIVGPAAPSSAPSASVLSPRFDPQSLLPAGAAPASSADAGGHDHHHHHHP